MIYLYALIDTPGEPIEFDNIAVQGLQGVLRSQRIGRWTLVFSDHDDKEILPKRRLLLAHTRVLETLLPLGTMLPARFGLVAPDLRSVLEMIEARSVRIAQEFDKVAGCVEIGLRVRFPRDEALRATLEDSSGLRQERERLSRRGPGAQFQIAEFGGRVAEILDRRRGAAQHQLLQALLPLCRSHVLRSPEDDVEVLRAEVLIPAARQAVFTQTLVTVASGLKFAPGAEPEIRLVGPVPAYNFVRLSLAFQPGQEAA